MKKPSVYIETSVISYLAARLSRDWIVAAHQQLTHDWWKKDRMRFELYASQFVLNEASSGDPEVAQLRLNLLQEISLLDMNDIAKQFSKELLTRKIVPHKASEDAVHIALSVVYRVDYLLTWNCKHIANLHQWRGIQQMCLAYGYSIPMMCTPEFLLGGSCVERPDC